MHDFLRGFGILFIHDGVYKNNVYDDHRISGTEQISHYKIDEKFTSYYE